MAGNSGGLAMSKIETGYTLQEKDEDAEQSDSGEAH